MNDKVQSHLTKMLALCRTMLRCRVTMILGSASPEEIDQAGLIYVEAHIEVYKVMREWAAEDQTGNRRYRWDSDQMDFLNDLEAKVERAVNRLDGSPQIPGQRFGRMMRPRNRITNYDW